MKKILSTLLFILLAFVLFAESRNALLIANGKYKNFSSLANPVPEAEGLKKSLIELGFDVTIVTNASKEDMETAILDFQKKLSANKGIGFFHYGGHAVQVNGENYLIPADADIPDEPRVSSRAVNVSEVMSSMQADTNIVILDSCRNNPLPSGSGRSASRGLQMVKVRPKNSVIVYSAEAGKTAQDGVFTPILTKRILENKDLITVLRDVRKEVYNRTNGEQTPGQYDQLMNEVFLAMNVPSRLAKVESEASELDKQLEALRAQRANAQNREEQNRIAMEQQRIESEKKRKELELQQVREAEARRAAEAKRIAEENAKKNENQRLQEQQFAKMQADNAAKLKEIERLNAATNIDEMVASANSLYQTINNITASYTASMNKAIDETKAFYQKKKSEIVKSKYESEAEFADRCKSEEAVIDSQQNHEIAVLEKQYGDEIINNTAELKRKLNALEKQTETQVGNNIKLTFGEYNAEKRFFPATITDTNNPSLKLGCLLTVNSEKENITRDEFLKRCTDIENKINIDGYVGFIEYVLSFENAEQKYIKFEKRIGIQDVDNGEKIVEGDVIDKLGTEDYFIFEKRIKFLGDKNIEIGDIAYEGGKFCKENILLFKAIGVVFAVSPQVKIVNLTEKKEYVNEYIGERIWSMTWDEGKTYCESLTDGGGGWYMPDNDEWNQIYQNKDVINQSLSNISGGNILSNYRYWSSVDAPLYNAAYYIRMESGYLCDDWYYNRFEHYYVRAVKVY